MGHPLNRHHPKRHASPTFDFALKSRPPEDTPEQRAEKERLVAQFIAKRDGVGGTDGGGA